MARIDLSNLFGKFDTLLNNIKQENDVLVDTIESDEYFAIIFDLPGCNKTNIKIELQNNTLIISCVKNLCKIINKNNLSLDYTILKKQRPEGRIKKEITIPEDIDKTTMQTNYEDGVLIVHFQYLFNSPPLVPA